MNYGEFLGSCLFTYMSVSISEVISALLPCFKSYCPALIPRSLWVSDSCSCFWCDLKAQFMWRTTAWATEPLNNIKDMKHKAIASDINSVSMTLKCLYPHRLVVEGNHYDVLAWL